MPMVYDCWCFQNPETAFSAAVPIFSGDVLEQCLPCLQGIDTSIYLPEDGWRRHHRKNQRCLPVACCCTKVRHRAQVAARTSNTPLYCLNPQVAALRRTPGSRSPAGRHTGCVWELCVKGTLRILTTANSGMILLCSIQGTLNILVEDFMSLKVAGLQSSTLLGDL